MNLCDLERLPGNTFSADRLLELGVIKKLGDGLKILATGNITRSIEVEAHIFSKAAAEKIEKAGGVAKVIGAAAA